ncbi:hypothetical protein KAH81_07785 [bacterium]|nr:hypothetical protein [bacterium]
MFFKGKIAGVYTLLAIGVTFIFCLSCSEGIGPSATENLLAGSVNLGELSGVSASDIKVYLVEFQTTGMARVDSVTPDYTGEYEFEGFDFGNYGIESSTAYGIYPNYYGFHDGNRNGSFGSGDAVVFSSYGHVSYYNVPLYGDFPDTIVYELEPNNDAFLSQELGIIHCKNIRGDLTSGGFSPPDQYTGDLDLYHFEAVWTGYLVAELSWSSSYDLDLFLYDGSALTVIQSAATEGYGPERLYNSLYRGDDFILLVASIDGPSSYELSINIE